MFLYYFLIFFFGAVIGSFLNVVILRYGTGKKIINARSQCPGCKKVLKWYELIPVLSFIIQGGKCRSCKNKISWQYPTVELLAGLMFLLTFQFTRYSLLVTGYYFIIFSLLIIIAVYDLRHQIIPDLLVYLFSFLAFLNLFRISIFEFRIYDFLAGLIFFAFFGLLWFVSKGKWMGFGDAKLVLGIGWLLGLLKGFMALLFSFWVGALVGVFLLFFFKKDYNLKSKVPFGPFLVLGTIIAFFWGDAIIKLI